MPMQIPATEQKMGNYFKAFRASPDYKERKNKNEKAT